MTHKPIRLRVADVPGTRRFCPEREGGCSASLTETDYECGYCTNCLRPLTTENDDGNENEDRD